jgi:Caspase domain
MRKALIVGINYYQNISGLFGCVDDAHAVRAVLDRHGDGTVNFGSKLLTGTGPTDIVSRVELRKSIVELFDGECETALFYFAGHGHLEATGGYLIASDAVSGDEGVPLSDVITFANKSAARNRVIVLDSCHSGAVATSTTATGVAEIKEGTTILAASTAEQYATEENGAGVFSSLFADALAGAASNLVGEVTPGSIYAHIDQSLGPWDQRPVFKTNVKTFVSLRRVQPPIALADLQRITEFFSTPGQDFPLDPTFEPERESPDALLPPPNPINTAKFAILQKYNRLGLVVPVDAPHMWHAAVGSKACRLTVLGEHYWRLVQRGRI